MAAMKNPYISQKAGPRAEAVAIVGMACTFPKAPDIEIFWRNIVEKVDAVTQAPANRWDVSRFYDPRVADGSKIYGRRGGYLDSPWAFNPGEFGIMPKAVEGGEPDQFLVLKTAADAVRDAGIQGGAGLERTDFILGRGSYLSVGAFNLLQRSFIVDQTVRLVSQLQPDLPAEDLSYLKKALLSSLKPFEAETAPSVMPNISAGRVANRLGFMGPNYTIDAACASSLFAVDAAVSHLLAGRCDMALAGGVHIFNSIPFLSVFCALGAMSRSDQIRPFDLNADGLVPGEGVGIVVLKRLADAVRDGNRIYALIRGVGSSSDGRGGSVAAPRVEGEVLALERAYQAAGVLPATIGLIEAHGTATRVGDAAEIKALTTVFGPKAQDAARHCALGTVKSMIGHAMPAAGIAGLIKTALALYHKVLPPTLHCAQPDPKFKLEQTPFYINTEARPWFRLAPEVPRRAGVNAFGFGGVNAHIVLEEHTAAATFSSCGPQWDACLFLFAGDSPADLVQACAAALEFIAVAGDLDFPAWSRTLVRGFKPAAHRLAVIAASPADLTQKLQYAMGKLKSADCKKIKDIKGIYYFADSLGRTGKLVFMFPGEGSPYPNMLLDLCLHFPEVRAIFEEIDQVIAGRAKKSRYLPSQFIFPATLLSPMELDALTGELWKIDSGLQAILAANLAMNALLARFGIHPDMIVGHSAGEYSAWIASGILDRTQLYRNQEQIADLYAAHPPTLQTVMTAVSGGFEKIAPLVQSIPGSLYISNDNCPHQVVAVGEIEAMSQLKDLLKARGILFTDLPSLEVHHTPLAAHQSKPLTQAFGLMEAAAPRVPVYSAITTGTYPEEPAAILDLMVDYWLKPLRFRQTVEAIHNAGGRIFIEVGAGTNLCGFVDDTLRGRPFISVAANNSRRSGISQLCHVLGMLAAQHVALDFSAYDPPRKHAVSGRQPATAKTAAILHLDLGLPELRLENPDRLVRPKALQAAAAPSGAPQPPPADAAPIVTTAPACSVLPAPSSQAPIMQKYMDNMAQFLALQKEIMLGLNARVGPEAAMAHERSVLPYTGRLAQVEAGKSCRVQRVVDLKNDLFLLDHPFGDRVSDIDQQLLPLIVTPLTLNMEIMAEAASLVLPEENLLEMKAVRAHRWVEVKEDGGTALRVQALRTSPNEIAVQLSEAAAETPSAEAVAVFGAEYPPADESEVLTLRSITPKAAERAKEIYARKWMPHGPRFQMIVGLDHAASQIFEADLRVPSDRDLFAAIRSPKWLLSPLLLDACAQLTGYWAQKILKEKYITFPAGVQRIRFWAPPPQAGELLRARLQIRDVNDHFVRSDVTISLPDGRPWVSVLGWTHRRFDLPLEFYHFWKFPREHTVSHPLEQSSDESQAEGLQCRTGYYEDLNQTIWKKAIARLYMNRTERQMYLEKLSAGNGAERWLAGRIAAKDAVRLFLKKSQGLKILPADVELADDNTGQLTATASGHPAMGRKLKVEIKHTDQFAAAFVAETNERENKNNGQTG